MGQVRLVIQVDVRRGNNDVAGIHREDEGIKPGAVAFLFRSRRCGCEPELSDMAYSRGNGGAVCVWIRILYADDACFQSSLRALRRCRVDAAARTSTWPPKLTLVWSTESFDEYTCTIAAFRVPIFIDSARLR